MWNARASRQEWPTQEALQVFTGEAPVDIRKAAHPAARNPLAAVLHPLRPATSRLPEPSLEHLSPQLRFATQVIVDVSGKPVGRELLFRWNSSDAPVNPNLGAYATAVALSHALLDGQLLLQAPSGLPVGSLYVNMDERYLMSPMAEALTPEIGVIELLETIVPTPEICKRVQELHQRGYRFSLDDLESLDDPRWALAEYVESVKIDVRATAPDQLKPMIGMARAAGLRVVAEKVETDAEKALLASLGAQLFQGYGIERPQVHSVAPLPGCKPHLVGALYTMAVEGARCEAMSMVAEADPALVARLLRLQALHAPQDVAMSHDLAEVMASLPRHVLVGWLAQLNISSLHVRRQDAVAAVSKQMATHRAEVGTAGPIQAAERRAELFSRYRALVERL